MLSFRGLRVCQRSLSGEWLEQRKLLSSMSLSNMESKNCRRDIDVSRLAVVNKIGTPSTMPPLEDLKFGQFYSDHFLDVEWDDVNGWRAPMILPLQCIQMHPGSSALHYGLQIFEGMKAYKNARGEVLLFRPDLNMARLNKSARRMALPEFDETEMLRLIARLLKVDERFIPEKDGFSAYIRPVMYSTHVSTKVQTGNRSQRQWHILLLGISGSWRTSLGKVERSYQSMRSVLSYRIQTSAAASGI
eukprot:GHVQ01036367.1.p1 GENE.GHVQ01036367.1~~GHVQ01036367.1.p1  ORF type:complete len:246 (+),score=20.84 GHVQ01036367.1:240-977(+)